MRDGGRREDACRYGNVMLRGCRTEAGKDVGEEEEEKRRRHPTNPHSPTVRRTGGVKGRADFS